MHKDREPNSTPPFRPMVSSIGTYNHNLCRLLTPHIPTDYSATDTFTFVQNIQSLSTSRKFIVSFDVESLFTNIPLEECIDLAVDYVSEGDPDIKLNKSKLRSLFITATTQTHFIFNGSCYDQIDGVAMGSPLAPVLAYLFMGHHEKFRLKNFHGSTILFYAGMLIRLFASLTQIAMSLHFSTTSTLGTLTSNSLWKSRLITNYPF